MQWRASQAAVECCDNIDEVEESEAQCKLCATNMMD